MPDQEADEQFVSDPELITLVRAGDRAAFGELYRRHAGPATTLARQFARSAAESDDLVSESFARVLDNLLAGKGPDTAFRAYLFTSIRNTAYDRTRKDKRLQFTDDMTAHDAAVVAADPVLAKMESSLVATAFATLPERWQAVLWHTQVEGETPAQVGALLGMAPGAVSSLAFRAREGLREAYLQAHLAETAAEKCRTTVERLGAWTRGGLSKREKAQVDAHLEECDRCRALAAELAEVNQGLRAVLAPLLLGGAAAGYLATLGPVAPLAVPGAFLAGAGGAGAGTAGGAGAGAAGGASAGTAGAGTAGGAGAAGTAGTAGGAGAAGTVGAGTAGTAAGSVGAGVGTGAAGGAAGTAGAGAAGAGAAAAGAGTAGAGAAAGAGGVAGAGAGAAGAGAAGAGVAGAGVAAGAGATGGTAATAASAAAAAAVASTAAVGLPAAANAATGAGGAGAGAAGAGGAGAAGAGGAGAAGAGGAGAAGAGAGAAGAAGAGGAGAAGAAAGAAVGAAAGAGVAGGAAAASGLAGVLAGVGGLVAAGAVVVVTAVAAVALIVSNNSTETTAASDQPAVASAEVSSSAGGELAIGSDGITIAATGTGDAATATAAGVAAPVETETLSTAENVLGTDNALGTGTGVVDDTGSTETDSTETGGVLPGTADTDSTGDVGPVGNDIPVAVLSTETAPTATTDPAATSQPEVPADGTTPSEPTTAPLTPTGPTSPPAPVPADLGVTDLAATPLTAGDSGTLSMTISNTGDEASAPEPLTISAPDGVQITAVEVGPEGAALRRANAGLLRAGPLACAEPVGGICTTVLPAMSGHSMVTVTVTLVASPTAAGGDLAVSVFDRSTTYRLRVDPRPADLRISQPTDPVDAVAGGSGSFSVLVENIGGTASTPVPIVVNPPDGVMVTDITIAGTSVCESAEPANVAAASSCTLPETTPGGSRTLDIAIAVLPTVRGSSVTVTVDIGRSIDAVVPLRTGIAALTADTSDPLAAGTTTTLSVSAEPVGGVDDAGPVELTSDRPDTVTFRDSADCTTSSDAASVVCTGAAFDLTVDVAVQEPSGELPVHAADAGDRPLDLLGGNGKPLQVTAAAPAKLTYSPLGVSEPLLAGGTGVLTLTVNNVGALPSGDIPVSIATPDGVTVTGITADAAIACTAADTCTLAPVTAGDSVTLEFAIDVAPTTKPGPSDVTVMMADTPITTGLTVDTGIAALSADTRIPLVAGTSTTLSVTATPVDGIAEPGPVTLTSTSPQVTLSSTSCEPGKSQQLICAAPTFDLTVAIAAEQSAGDLPVDAADAGGRELHLTDAGGDPIQVTAAPQRLSLSELTVTRPPDRGVSILTLYVTNPGPKPSETLPITISSSKGIFAGAVIGSDNTYCLPLLTHCNLAPLASTKTRQLDFYMGVEPDVTEGTVTVTIDGTPRSVSFTAKPRLIDQLTAGATTALSVPAPVDAGPAGEPASEPMGPDSAVPPGPTATGSGTVEPGLTAPAAGPSADSLLAGDPRSTASAPSAGGGTGDGPPGGPSPDTGTTAAQPTSVPGQQEADGPGSRAISEQASPEPAVTVTPSQPPPDQPPVLQTPAVQTPAVQTPFEDPPVDQPPAEETTSEESSAPASTQPPTTEPEPARLSLSDPVVIEPLRSGGTGTFTATIANIGGSSSPEQPLTISLPPGVSTAGITVGGAAVGQGVQQCTVPRLEPGASVTITVALAATAEARDGQVTASVQGRDFSWQLVIQGRR